MTESHKCPRCGAELPPEAAGDHCVSCLLQLGLAAGQPTAPTGTQPDTIRINLTAPTPAEKPGDRIGRYKLLQQIGEGGCGVVYMAEQAEPVRRRVALKVIKLGMDTRQVIARFEAERQALAMMDHPNIARVLDAGATDAGRPYFVMELVRGIKITDYCDQQKLSTRQRLDLFVQVCQAVQHAHQKGVIHRDLKPSNILVTEQDGKAVPKIIDFGIAKATTAAPLTDKTLFTAFEQFIGTPAYMSPEQAGLGGLDVDTRSDVYSLGVLLYELLTGKQPFDSVALRRSAIDEILRTIREQEPPRPSASLTTLTEQELTIAAQRRQTEPAKFSNLLRGDLDWIVMKCLAKERARRYETANGLASDIRHHLNCEPVLARPPSRLYEFQRTVRRHKYGFAAASVVFAALSLGLGIVIWSLAQERAARLRADNEAAKSRETANFAINTIEDLDSIIMQSQDRKLLLNFLDQISARVNDFTNQPSFEAELELALGVVNIYAGRDTNAEPRLRHSLDLWQKVPGQKNERIGEALVWLAQALNKQGKYAEAEPLARQGLEIVRKNLAGDDPFVSTALARLGFALQGEKKYDEAEVAFREQLATQTQKLGGDDPRLAASLNNVARILILQGKTAEAGSLNEKVIMLQKDTLTNNPSRHSL